MNDDGSERLLTATTGRPEDTRPSLKLVEQRTAILALGDALDYVGDGCVRYTAGSQDDAAADGLSCQCRMGLLKRVRNLQDWPSSTQELNCGEMVPLQHREVASCCNPLQVDMPKNRREKWALGKCQPKA